jgi:hypothetical protein
MITVALAVSFGNRQSRASQIYNCWVLAAMHGSTLTQCAIMPDAMQRATGAVGETYAQWRMAVPARPMGHPDATGWRVRGDQASLMAFDTDAATVSQHRFPPRHEGGRRPFCRTPQGGW